MKVLVATRERQGQVPGDYAWTVDGELVTPVTAECCSPGTCGCGRGFVGLGSSRATTTAMVVERPDLDRETLRQALYDSLERQGWLGVVDDLDGSDGLDGEDDDAEGDDAEGDDAEDDDAALVDEHLVCIEYVCRAFPVGTVLSRWGSKVYARGAAVAA